MTKTELDLLRDCKTALQRWVCTYAPDECNPERVRETYTQIQEDGGTLAYIAHLNQRIGAALDMHLDEPNVELALLRRVAQVARTVSVRNTSGYLEVNGILDLGQALAAYDAAVRPASHISATLGKVLSDPAAREAFDTTVSRERERQATEPGAAQLKSRDQILELIGREIFSVRARFYQALDGYRRLVIDGPIQSEVVVAWPAALAHITLEQWNTAYDRALGWLRKQDCEHTFPDPR